MAPAAVQFSAVCRSAVGYIPLPSALLRQPCGRQPALAGSMNSCADCRCSAAAAGGIELDFDPHCFASRRGPVGPTELDCAGALRGGRAREGGTPIKFPRASSAALGLVRGTSAASAGRSERASPSAWRPLAATAGGLGHISRTVGRPASHRPAACRPCSLVKFALWSRSSRVED